MAKNDDMNEFLRNLGKPPSEPTSDQRQAALMLREMYEAFAYAGFTDDQAFQLTLTLFRSSFTTK